MNRGGEMVSTRAVATSCCGSRSVGWPGYKADQTETATCQLSGEARRKRSNRRSFGASSSSSHHPTKGVDVASASGHDSTFFRGLGIARGATSARDDNTVAGDPAWERDDAAAGARKVVATPVDALAGLKADAGSIPAASTRLRAAHA